MCKDPESEAADTLPQIRVRAYRLKTSHHTWNTWVYDNDLSMFSRYCLPDELLNEIIVLKTRIS